MTRDRVVNRWEVGEYTFTEYADTWLGEGVTLFGVAIRNKETGELYGSLDWAMVAAVGEKYTGPRGAGGSGVGTAADWFARMIGME